VRRITTGFLAALMVIGIVAGPATAAPASTAPSNTIADIAIANGNFTTLVAALSCTGLVPAVADPQANLTVFAPTDAAFAKFGLTTKTVCLLPKSILSSILLYHVAPGRLFAADVLASRRIPTLNGGFLYPSVRGGSAYLNLYAKIVATDIGASNGVIHVIDSVLIPLRLA
jgi:uncharacterized surface protein with fasciclin (FAS1) repeats